MTTFTHTVKLDVQTADTNFQAKNDGTPTKTVFQYPEKCLKYAILRPYGHTSNAKNIVNNIP